MSRPDQHRAGDSGEDRKEFGNRASSQRHPPHVTENDQDRPVQDDMPSPDDAPVLPANASGSDKVGVDEQSQPIDDESMYDNRPERDKDRPASGR